MSTNARPTALEVAAESAWYKSSHSGENGGGGCVSIAPLANHVGIRDSKHSDGPALVMPTAAWRSFVRVLRSIDAEVDRA